MGHLLSKLVAGGLSAAVVLLWWPLVFPSDTVESWLVRGIAWTASFELMLHAFMPVEESLWRSRAARRVREQAARAGGRIAVGRSEDKMRLRMAVACVALMVPLALLATAPTHPLGPKPAPRTDEPKTGNESGAAAPEQPAANAPATGGQ